MTSLIQTLWGRRKVLDLAPKGEKERHEIPHLMVERRKEKYHCLHLRGVGTTNNGKGIEVKSSYTQGEQFLHHVDCVPSNEDVYEDDDFSA